MYLSLPVFEENEVNYKAPFFIENCIKEYCKEVINNLNKGIP